MGNIIQIVSPTSPIGFAKSTPFTFRFDYNYLINAGTTVTELIWNFGDGSDLVALTPSNSNNIVEYSHVYTEPGIYRPTLTIKTSKSNVIYTLSLTDNSNPEDPGYTVFINSFTPKETGYVKGTKFTFSLDFFKLPPLPKILNADVYYYKAIWDFGDGNRQYDELRLGQLDLAVTHIYTFPGNYKVTLTILDNIGSSVLKTFALLGVDLFYKNSITLTGPDTIIAGTANTYTVNVTSINTNPEETLSIVAYVSGSNSIPDYAVPPKWNFITPRWRLIESGSLNPSINKLGIPISNVLPLTGSACAPTDEANTEAPLALSSTYVFDYIDDKPGTTTLIVSLSTGDLSNPTDSAVYSFPSHSNPTSDSFVTKQITVNSNTAHHLKVTENVLNDVFFYKWANVPIPIMITSHSSDENLVFNYPTQDTQSITIQLSSHAFGVKSASDYYTLSDGTTAKYFTINETSEFKKTEPGYVFTSITPLSGTIGIPLRIKVTAGNLLGTSAEFKVYDLDNAFTVSKVNDNFDYGDYFYKLTLPSLLKTCNTLFEYVSAIGGDSVPAEDNIGQMCYEKIANFVPNHSDYQTAEIDKLLSLCAQTSIKTKKYTTDYPVAVKKMLDIFSIPKHKLRGRKEEQINIDSIGVIFNENSIIIADNFYYLKDKTTGEFILIQAKEIVESEVSYNQYQARYLTLPANSLKSENLFVDYTLYQVGKFSYNQNDSLQQTLEVGKLYWATSPGTNEYPLIIQAKSPNGSTGVFSKNNLNYQHYAKCGFPVNFASTYEFRKAVNYNVNSYYDNIIDWDSPHTNTFSYEVSSSSEWYGENGLIELAFNNLLTKHLFQE